MLDGFDETWSDWTTETRKDYTNLPEGTYRFRVRARDAFDEPGSEASFAFVLLPPWYRTTWAYLFYALVGVLALVGLDHLRRRRMAHKTRALEAVVETRTAEVRARNEDLRKQKRITEAQAERLRELDELKNRFFANISHEFRTPLTLTIGPLEDVLERQDLSDEVTADLDLALRNARRLLRLTNQILDIAKLEAGQMVLHRQYADLGAFAEDIALAFSPLAERQDVAYRIETRPVLASFDPDQFEKVIINLLSNAFKFTPKGNAILLRVEAVGGTAQLTVRNNGPGIPAEKLPHLFERFYQVDSSSTRVQTGTGIGLALVKELVELHDGTVAVESEEGFGTTFTVALPQAKAVGDEQISASGQSEAQTLVRDLLTQPASQESSPTMPQGNKAPDDAASEDEDRTTVLVVDDNAEVRTFIRRRLEDTYRVVEAADGAAGLEAARRVLPDLILCDVMMPGMDGYELCRTLKADPELDYLPVILLTAKASPESKIEGLHEGADDYLTKPFEARELIARVANLIDSRRRLQARFSTSLPTHQAVSLPAPPKGFAQQVREVVEAHLTDPDFSVERLADALNQSRSNLHRRLTLEMDESPTTFIRRVRLEHGAALLAERDGTISEVAYAVGFKSVSHFSQCFRKHFDMTPSEFVGLAPQEKGATSVGTPGA